MSWTEHYINTYTLVINDKSYEPQREKTCHGGV